MYGELDMARLYSPYGELDKARPTHRMASSTCLALLAVGLVGREGSFNVLNYPEFDSKKSILFCFFCFVFS